MTNDQYQAIQMFAARLRRRAEREYLSDPHDEKARLFKSCWIHIEKMIITPELAYTEMEANDYAKEEAKVMGEK